MNARTSLPYDRINLARKLLRFHGEIRTWVELNRDRRPPGLVFAVEWMGCAIYCAGANGLDAREANEMSEAIPPAYAEYIAKQWLLRQKRRRRRRRPLPRAEFNHDVWMVTPYGMVNVGS
jgi:hypothetical protein